MSDAFWYALPLKNPLSFPHFAFPWFSHRFPDIQYAQQQSAAVPLQNTHPPIFAILFAEDLEIHTDPQALQFTDGVKGIYSVPFEAAGFVCFQSILKILSSQEILAGGRIRFLPGGKTHLLLSA